MQPRRILRNSLLLYLSLAMGAVAYISLFQRSSEVAYAQTKKKITDYTEDTSPAAADLIYTVKSPYGATYDRKVQLSNVPKSFLSAITSGYLLYANASNTFSGGPFWDATNARLGINTATPNRDLVLFGAGIPVMTFNNTTTGVASGDGAAFYMNGSDFYLENQESAGTNIVKATASTQIPLTVTMAASQSATPFVIKNSAGTVIVSSGADGAWTFGADLYSAMASSQSAWYHRNSGDTKFYLQTNSTSGHTRIDSDHKILIAPNNTAYAEFSTAGHLILGGGAASSEFRILEPSGSGTNYNAFKTAAQAGNVTYTLPTADAAVSGYQLTSDAAGTLSWAAAGSGGVTKFTEAESTAAPNNTVYVDSLTAAGATTNADAAFSPKGTGALLADVPDSTATGGNKRGANAVDLQTSRNVAAEVASGTNATIVGGTGNKASGNNSSALGGAGNSATGATSIAGGSGATASGDYAVALGNTATASGSYAYALGLNTAASLYGQHSQASGNFSTVGDAQTSVVTLRNTTANGLGGTVLFLDGASTRLVIPANTTWAADITVVARSSADHSMWTYSTPINRDGSNNTTIPGSVSNPVNQVDYSSGASSWSVTITADDANECLKIGVTGAAATNIKWVARVELTEVAG